MAKIIRFPDMGADLRQEIKKVISKELRDDIDPECVIECFSEGRYSFQDATRLLLASCNDHELTVWVEQLILVDDARKTLRRMKNRASDPEGGSALQA